MKFEKWNIGTPKQQDIDLLVSAGYPYLLSTVLAARNIATPELAAEFLERDRSLSVSPLLMKDMDKAVARIQRAIADDEIIVDAVVKDVSDEDVTEDTINKETTEEVFED